MSEEIPIVNEQDQIIGYKERDAVAKEDIYRVSALWVTNSQGQILLAQRAFTKHHHPGKWGPAVAGTVEKGETYKQNIIKEAEEEIGLKNIRPQNSKKVRVTPATGNHNHFTQWYTLVIDKPIDDFVVRKEEVAQVKWFKPDELKDDLTAHPDHYLPNLSWNLQNL